MQNPSSCLFEGISIDLHAYLPRARVLEIVSGPEGKGTQYIVQSLDYASVTAVPMDYIFPLRDLYNTFPIQAVRAELYGKFEFILQCLSSGSAFDGSMDVMMQISFLSRFR